MVGRLVRSAVPAAAGLPTLAHPINSPSLYVPILALRGEEIGEASVLFPRSVVSSSPRHGGHLRSERVTLPVHWPLQSQSPSPRSTPTADSPSLNPQIHGQPQYSPARAEATDLAMASALFLFLLLVPPVGLLAALAFLVRPRAARIPIKGRHVFITGGSSGIGLAMATAAAREGAKVSILARNAARLEDARAAIKAATGHDVGVHQADVRDADALARALEEAGPVDVLVCNHGVFVAQELEKQDMEEVKWMVDINLMGTFHLIKAALPAMKARTRETRLPASIAIMSSQAGQVGVYGYTAYSASKFALTGLAESLQHEVILDNIHVSLIFPPDTETPGFAEEQKKRPEITTIIAGSSGGMKADAVSKKALNGIKSGRFIVPCNFEGAMLAVATSGLTPQSSPLMAFVEVIGAGLMRFAALCFQWNWFSTIECWYANKHA